MVVCCHHLFYPSLNVSSDRDTVSYPATVLGDAFFTLPVGRYRFTVQFVLSNTEATLIIKTQIAFDIK